MRWMGLVIGRMMTDDDLLVREERHALRRRHARRVPAPTYPSRTRRY